MDGSNGFPAELVYSIALHLQPIDLASLALVSRLHSAEAVRVLYRAVIISSPFSVNAFDRTICEHADKANLVVSLDVALENCDFQLAPLQRLRFLSAYLVGRLVCLDSLLGVQNDQLESLQLRSHFTRTLDGPQHVALARFLHRQARIRHLMLDITIPMAHDWAKTSFDNSHLPALQSLDSHLYDITALAPGRAKHSIRVRTYLNREYLDRFLRACTSNSMRSLTLRAREYRLNRPNDGDLATLSQVFTPLPNLEVFTIEYGEMLLEKEVLDTLPNALSWPAAPQLRDFRIAFKSGYVKTTRGYAAAGTVIFSKWRAAGAPKLEKVVIGVEGGDSCCITADGSSSGRFPFMVVP
ncbi:hypothetical protein EXIGLDRAFT_719569 [Exidia glandulosa HHB12029]|uniref:F-box domain-containing protein n=1 Tax=Exidia glandulosa HHB12029 TaxID=1314781 RepID=A0A165H0T5_EXIGL|nr:hypothetical protein EXIGLDRAFT_719569 [Exidia glandulosa HHB12029]